ncbi:hypothetical protein EVAR_22144_1 [Eumeta japonica]|uniref:Uncharacterized protein n=1 Tax=Eumeta variegata TaxID=151549 RepID=A0A4C1W081_EUMVA|nr:hypothetical protein EVAR_22144_1 [Eumeta japonica]
MKLRHSELPANDVMPRFDTPRSFLLLPCVPILRHCGAFVTNFTAAEFQPTVTVEEDDGVSTDNSSGPQADSENIKIWTPEMGPSPLDRRGRIPDEKTPNKSCQVTPNRA